MATCGSLQHFFEKPMPENPTLLESLASWNQIKPVKPIELSTFTEIFGELHFKETPEPPLPSSSPSSINQNQNQESKTKEVINPNDYARCENKPLDFLLGARKNQDKCCFSSLNSESLQLCTEGLGFESSDEVENSKNERGEDWRNQEKKGAMKHSIENLGRSTRTCTDVIGTGTGFKISKPAGSFPPPISCIGRSGKPCFSLKSYRHDGRFVLTEIKIPNHEILHASREDGRLKLHLAPPSDKEEEEEEDEEDATNREDGGNEEEAAAAAEAAGEEEE